MSTLKGIAKSCLRKLGYEVWRIDGDSLGLNPFLDIQRLVTNREDPVILDVGANDGGTVSEFKSCFPKGIIHSFEPSPNTFSLLQKNTQHVKQLTLNNFALGGSCGTQEFFENASPGMSSLLQPAELAWGEVVNKRQIKVSTVDDYCRSQSIPLVNVLKTDVQGYDLEVLKGAVGLLRDNRIQLVLMEVIFSRQYNGIPPFDQVFRFMLDHNFKLVSMYRFYHQQNLASFSDALFLNGDYLGKNK